MPSFIKSALIAVSLAAVFALTTSAHPVIPGAKQTRPIALIGGTVHPISGPAIEDGTVLFDDGKIVAVGKKVAVPENARRIDCTGKHIYPGLFESISNIGLVEINAVRSTKDYAETGSINPNVEARVAVNPDTETIPVARSNGVLFCVAAPSSGLISGKSVVLQLDGWTFEDLTLNPRAGLHVNWPRMAPVSEWAVEASAKEQMEERDEALKNLRKTFDDARAYHRAKAAGTIETDLRWEAMADVLSRKTPLIVHADGASEIQAAVAFAVEQKVRLIIHGGYDAVRCATLLKKHDVPVIIAGVYRLPRRRSDDYDASYTLPARLKAAGVRFCISGEGRFGASGVRNLPYHAATAVAYGLEHEDALRAITLGPAEILGVSKRVGSLEQGKDASLFIADGDILETPTLVEAAYIQGREVDLSDKHKTLWKKYQTKYRRK